MVNLPQVTDPELLTKINEQAAANEAASVDPAPLGKAFGFGAGLDTSSLPEVTDPALLGRINQKVTDLEDSSFTGAVQDTLVSAGHGLTFGFDDDILEALGYEDYQYYIDLARERSPGLSLTGEIAGAVPWFLIPGANVANAARVSATAARAGLAASRTSRLNKTVGDLALRTAGSRPVTFAGEGAAYGALYGAGDKESLEGFRQDALYGALFGLGLGGAVSGAIVGGRAGAKAGKYALGKFDSVQLARLQQSSDNFLEKLKGKQLSDHTRNTVLNRVDEVYRNGAIGAYEKLSRGVGYWGTRAFPKSQKIALHSIEGKPRTLVEAVKIRNSYLKSDPEKAQKITNQIVERLDRAHPDSRASEIFKSIDETVERFVNNKTYYSRVKALTDDEQLDKLSKRVLSGKKDTVQYINETSAALDLATAYGAISKKQSAAIWNDFRYRAMERILNTTDTKSLQKLLSTDQGKGFVSRLFSGRLKFDVDTGELSKPPTKASYAIAELEEIRKLAVQADNFKGNWLYRGAEFASQHTGGFLGAGAFGFAVGGTLGNIAAAMGMVVFTQRAASRLLELLMKNKKMRQRIYKLFKDPDNPQFERNKALLRNEIQKVITRDE